MVNERKGSKKHDENEVQSAVHRRRSAYAAPGHSFAGRADDR
jgi:hypothetical protein